MAHSTKATTRRREEDELLGQAFEIAKRHGTLAYHPLPAQIRPGRYVTAAQGDGAGWPDAVFAGLGGHLFREFKATDGVVEPEQQTWMDRLAEGGADVAVWRPADLLSGRITRELTAIKRPRRAPAGVGDVAAADAAAFRSALEQIRDADPTSIPGRIAADALIRQHRAAKEAVRG